MLAFYFQLKTLSLYLDDVEDGSILKRQSLSIIQDSVLADNRCSPYLYYSSSDQHQFSPNNNYSTCMHHQEERLFENSANVDVIIFLTNSLIHNRFLSRCFKRSVWCGINDFFPERFHVQILDVMKLHVNYCLWCSLLSVLWSNYLSRVSTACNYDSAMFIMRVKNDHRSEFSNLSNWTEEAWKKSGL